MDGHVLIVDDDAPVRNLLKRVLETYGERAGVSRVFVAASGREALRVLLDYSVDLMIVDVQLDKMTGPQLVEAARHAFPDIKSLYITGGMTDCRPVIWKPFTPQKIADGVRELLMES